MIFRPCIDLHDGKVKQIVGSTLRDDGRAVENFISSRDSSYFAGLFKRDRLVGGHIIMLGKSQSNKEQAMAALATYPGGMQVGGGITADNAMEYINAGASHVIVTSYVFDSNGFNRENLCKLTKVCGREKIVLDLSAKKVNDKYFIAADRWQTVTNVEVNDAFLLELSKLCDEFLVHAVNNEGKKQGVDEELISILSASPIPVTYAGGIGEIHDIDIINKIGRGRVDFTVGSALDLFGGYIKYDFVKQYR